MAGLDPWADDSDEALLHRLQQGELMVFGLLVRRYERELYGYLRRYLGDDEMAADVFQTTFVTVYRKIGQYEPGRPAKPWIYAVAKNQAIDAIRKNARRRERLVDPRPGEEGLETATLFDQLAARDIEPSESVAAIEQEHRVRDTVDQLPDLYRDVILLAYFQGLKYQDVADVLGIPLGTVKSRLNAAVARLAELWHHANPDGSTDG